MSSRLYKEALADAKMLKEMAKQAAEQELIEKHSAEFRNLLLNKLFEKKEDDKKDLLLDEEESHEDSDNLNIDDFENSSKQDALSPDLQSGVEQPKPEGVTGDFNSSEPTETVEKVPFAALDNKGSVQADEEIEIDLDGITPGSDKSLETQNQAQSPNNIDISVNSEVKDDIQGKEPEQNVQKPEKQEELVDESIMIPKSQFFLYLEKDLEQEERIHKLEEKLTKFVDENEKQQKLLTIYEKQLKESNKKLEESIKLEYKFNILADSSLSGRQKKGLIEAIDKVTDVKSIGNIVEALKNNIVGQEVKNTSLIEIKSKKAGSTFFVTKQPINESKEDSTWSKFRELAGIQGVK